MRNAWGDTEIRGDIVLGIKNLPASKIALEKALDKLIDGCKKETIPAHSLIFRIRKNPKNLHKPSEFDAPPSSILSNDGRFNNKEFSLFYCSSDPETCLYESKFDPVDKIILATFEVVAPIKIVDLTHHDDRQNDSFGGDLEVFISAICRSTKDCYLLKYISKRIYERGYAGFKYYSFFNRYREIEYNNIALFGHPVAEKKLKLNSLNNIDVNGLQLNWAMGPALAFHDPESIIDDGLY